MAIGPVTGRKYRGYWSGNRVVRGIYGRARDQLRVSLQEWCTRRSQDSLRDSTHLQGVQAACNLALKRVERPLACVALWRKDKDPCAAAACLEKCTFCELTLRAMD